MASCAVHLETFGCQMNELDSELVAGALRALGWRLVDDPDEAQVLLYNTCSVRDHAEQKVRSRLGELAERKRREPSLVVGVIGCMAERDGARIFQKHPVVDVLCGPAELDRLPALLDNALRTRRALAWDRPARLSALQGGASRRTATLAAAEDRLELLDLSRSMSPADHNGSAYVRITRGCNKFCTYCVVPYTRGAEVHRPPDHIVQECRRLADAGVLEVTLLGQTVNHYRYEHGAAALVNGVAQPQKGRAITRSSAASRAGSGRVTTFADLLHRVHEEVPALRRIRFVTSYPRDFTDEALQVMRDCERICRYLHAPAQSGSDAVLARMNRGYTVAEYLEFVDRARQIVDAPQRPLMIAGDIIVGFPGETEEDFQATLRLLERARYKNCFIFKYSPRPGTVAFEKLPDDVPEEVKRRRNNQALAVQQRISEETAQRFVGQVVEVLVQGASPRQRRLERRRTTAGAAVAPLTVGGRPAAAPARSGAVAEAPERVERPASPQMAGRTDGDMIVLFDAPPGRSPDELTGALVDVRITEAGALSLFGELVRG